MREQSLPASIPKSRCDKALGFQVGEDNGFNDHLYLGWTQMLYQDDGLMLIDSARETTGVGIFAGTYVAVPEPATLSLLGLGGLAVVLKRRNR